nr:site-specific DNA-methyltransferase [Candidatus Thiodictyon syntrophicum]
MQRILALIHDPHAVVLDFFAGSGTTVQAVLQLIHGDLLTPFDPGVEVQVLVTGETKVIYLPSSATPSHSSAKLRTHANDASSVNARRC